MANNAAFSAYVNSITQDRFIPNMVQNVLDGMRQLQRRPACVK